MNLKARLLIIRVIVSAAAGWAAFAPFLCAQERFAEIRSDDCSLFVDTERINSVVFTTDSSRVDVAQLTVKILPADEFICFVNLPDGGDMLVNTGSPEDEENVKSAVSKELTEMSMEYDMMKLFGWKARIDWLVLTSNLPENIGGFLTLLQSFEIKQLVTPLHANFSKPAKISQLKVSGFKKIDLLQVISPVSLEVTELTKPDYSKNCLALKYSYSNYSFSVLLDMTESDIEKIPAEFLDSTVIFANTGINKNNISKSGAKMVFTQARDIEFVTDGKLLYFSAPGQIKSKFYDIIFHAAK